MIISLSFLSSKPHSVTVRTFSSFLRLYILRCARFFKAFLLLSLSLSLSVFLRIRVRIRSGREKENLDRRHKTTASGVLHCLGCSYFFFFSGARKKSSQFVRTKRHLTLCSRLWNVRKNHDDFTIKRYKEEGTALLLSLSLMWCSNT